MSTEAAKNDRNLTPSLRFPEFRSSAPWPEQKLHQIAESEASTLSLGRLELKASGYPVFGADGIVGYVDKFDQGQEYVSVVKDGAGIGRLRFCPACSSILSTLTYLKVKPGADASLAWLFYLLQTLDIAQYSKGSGIPHVYFSDYSKHVVGVPNSAEQRKIAECLTSLDNLISAEGRRLEALRIHKKGLMQALFPRQGETRPRLRFPEFGSAAEWDKQSLSKLLEIASGQVNPTTPPYCELFQVGSENIESNSGQLVNLRSARDKGIMSGNYAFDENDILYSKIRPALNKVATPTFKGICSADIYPIRPVSGALSRRYLFYLLLSDDFLKYAIGNSERGKIPKINRESLLSYETTVPPPAEQQRIAACLSSLDTLITAQSRQLDALRTLKKGLMQGLFPSEDDKGEVRCEA